MRWFRRKPAAPTETAVGQVIRLHAVSWVVASYSINTSGQARIELESPGMYELNRRVVGPDA